MSDPSLQSADDTPMRIPDYLIYDEIRRRQRQERTKRDYLELPLYQPIPTPPPREPDEDDTSGERGVTIINMNDWLDDEDDEDDDASNA